jgi:Ran GTPase-activating protein (RanGAP) involved in mRNA processing and transport
MPNTLLSHIYLAGNYIGNSGLETLANGLKQNDRVMSLGLANNEISGIAGANAIGIILSNRYNQIRRLDLSKNPLGNAGIERFSNILRNEKCNLHYLNLSRCEFNHLGARSLYICIKLCHGLKTLILDKNKLTGPSTVVLT